VESARPARTPYCCDPSRPSICPILVASNCRIPCSTIPSYRRLLDDALAYLAAERDLRGIDPRDPAGFHATAHTADLAQGLSPGAAIPAVHASDQVRLLDAAWLRMTAPETPVFTHAEDERLAAAVLSVTRRSGLRTRSASSRAGQVRRTGKARLAAIATRGRGTRLQRECAQPAAQPAPAARPAGSPILRSGQLVAREKMLVTLQQIRR